MPVFVCHRRLLYDLLDVFIGGLYNSIHLRLVRRRVMMLNLELCAKLGDHNIIEIGTITVMILSRIPYRQIKLCLMNQAMTFLVT